MNEKALKAMMSQGLFEFLSNPETAEMVKNNSIAINISAITGVDVDTIIEDHSCVGLSATIDRLNSVYAFVCAGGKYEDYGT